MRETVSVVFVPTLQGHPIHIDVPFLGSAAIAFPKVNIDAALRIAALVVEAVVIPAASIIGVALTSRSELSFGGIDPCLRYTPVAWMQSDRRASSKHGIFEVEALSADLDMQVAWQSSALTKEGYVIFKSSGQAHPTRT